MANLAICTYDVANYRLKEVLLAKAADYLSFNALLEKLRLKVGCEFSKLRI